MQSSAFDPLSTYVGCRITELAHISFLNGEAEMDRQLAWISPAPQIPANNKHNEMCIATGHTQLMAYSGVTSAVQRLDVGHQ